MNINFFVVWFNRIEFVEKSFGGVKFVIIDQHFYLYKLKTCGFGMLF